MKITIQLLFVFIAAGLAGAAPFWSSPNPNFIVYSNMPVLISTNIATTNAVATMTVTNTQDTYRSTYHTLQLFYTSKGTNSTTVTINKTIDFVNFVPYSTNVFTGTNYAEYQLTGKWTGFQIISVFAATNATEQVNYLSQ